MKYLFTLVSYCCSYLGLDILGIGSVRANDFFFDQMTKRSVYYLAIFDSDNFEFDSDNIVKLRTGKDPKNWFLFSSDSGLIISDSLDNSS